MSLTLKSLETSGAALAALCIAGAGSQAHANTVDLNLGAFSNLDTTIAIDSTSPQFDYNSNVFFKDTNFGTLGSGTFASAGIGPSNNFIDTGATYSANASGIKLAGELTTPVTGYLQLSWLNGSNQTEFGFADFEDGGLKSITGESFSGGDITISTVSTLNVPPTPLPAAWTLFIGGAGMFGALAHRRRRRRKAAA